MSVLAELEAIWQAVVPDLPGFTVEHVPRIDSTNAELMRRARTGDLSPVLLVADEQTAGRGRLGKPWHSRSGQSLTFSLALPLAPADWSGLSLVVGISLAESLHPQLRLKWPNDLWWQQRKLGGILVETAAPPNTHSHSTASGQRLVVVGVGININRPDAAAVAAPAHSALPAMAPAGLCELCMGVTPGEALARLAPPLVRDVLRFEAQGFAAFAPRFAARDALHGLPVQLSDGSHGTACGVDDSGALRLQTAQGLRTVHSGEVGVRPC